MPSFRSSQPVIINACDNVGYPGIQLPWSWAFKEDLFAYPRNQISLESPVNPIHLETGPAAHKESPARTTLPSVRYGSAGTARHQPQQ